MFLRRYFGSRDVLLKFPKQRAPRCLKRHLPSVMFCFDNHAGIFANCGLCPGVYAVPEGHQHAVCGRADGGHRRGALEPPQTHRTQGAAAGRGPTRPVSTVCPFTLGHFELTLLSEWEETAEVRLCQMRTHLLKFAC